MDFDQAFDRLLGNEGGYSSNAADPGGETMWGITARVARANGYQGEMRLMPRDFAKGLYRRVYWDAARLEELPPLLRFTIFDAAVNSGVVQAVKWLQQAVGVDDDGVLGPATLAAARAADPLRASIAFYGGRLDLMTSLPTWGAFGRGWARRVAKNLAALAADA